MKQITIYIINMWHDDIGYSGRYIGPYTDKAEVHDKVKELCLKYNLTYIAPDGIFHDLGHSREETIRGEYMVGIEKELIESPIIGHILAKLINDEN